VYVGSTSASASAPSHAGTGIASTAVVALLRPDGQQVAELETALGQVQLCTYNADGSGRDCPYGTGSAGWSADNDHVLISVSSDTPPYATRICYLPTAGNTPCAAASTKAADPTHDPWDPAVSPDGSTLAVTVANGPIGTATTGDVALYNYATGAFIRDLTSRTTQLTRGATRSQGLPHRRSLSTPPVGEAVAVYFSGLG
jgi:hypothetical protein